MHLEIYKARDDVNAIVHTHSVFATAHAVAINQLSLGGGELELRGRVDVAPFALPGTPELARNVAETLGRKNAVLLRNHGATCVGRDLDETFLNALYLEDTAKICYIAAQLGNPQPLPDNIIKTIIAKMSIWLCWSAVVFLRSGNLAGAETA